MTVYNVFIHFRNNIERVRNDSITNTDVYGNTRLVLSLGKSYLPSTGVGLGSPLAVLSVYGEHQLCTYCK